jgi:23S rRNA (uridine2552-2'-O)-methyltransferase
VRRKLSPKGAAVGALDGTILALDILPMEPVEGVTFLQGDFREPEVPAQLEAAGRPQGRRVVSDMAPNLSGIESSDAARISHLVELAVEFAQATMKPRAPWSCKVFHGSGYSQLVKLFKETFPRRQASQAQGLAGQVVGNLPGGHGPEDHLLTGVHRYRMSPFRAMVP